MSDKNEKRLEVLKAWLSEARSEVDANIHVKLWDGTMLPMCGTVNSDIVLAINSPDVIRRLMFAPKIETVVELYVEELLDIQGGTPIEASQCWDHIKLLNFVRSTPKAKLAKSLWPFVMRGRNAKGGADTDYTNKVEDRLESGRNDKDLIAHHYDVSNDFYALFLDPEMVYSCGYFATPETSLADAQVAKLDHICRKLRLEKGDRLLDIGCGWGGLSCHAAGKYGAKVHGVTLSEEQFDFANAKVKRLGLEDKVKLELVDYRSIKPEGQYDKISQVEMFEHVGLDNHDRHFQHMHDLLRTRGLYFHQASTRLATKDLGSFRKQTGYQKFISRFIFPGGELDYVGLTVTNMERFRFEVHDVEGMREHFALTLEHWVNRLWDNQEKAAAMVGRPKTRLWIFYMAMCCIAFRRSAIGLFQVVGSKRRTGPSGLPMTREHLYRASKKA